MLVVRKRLCALLTIRETARPTPPNQNPVGTERVRLLYDRIDYMQYDYARACLLTRFLCLRSISYSSKFDFLLPTVFKTTFLRLSTPVFCSPDWSESLFHTIY
jgi:hypothetical protein